MRFKLTTNTKILYGKKLFQIQATASFGDVKEGDLGGWVESESVIQTDTAWLYPGAIAFNGARIHGGEFLGGVFLGGEFLGGEFLGGVFRDGVFRGGVFWGGEFLGGVFRGGVFRGGVFRGGVFWGGEFWNTFDWHYIAGPQGSRGEFVTAVWSKEKGLRWNVCSTRHDITSDQFREAINETHGENEHAHDYLALIEFVENHPSLLRKMKEMKND